MQNTNAINFEDLARPFPPDDIEFRVGSVSERNESCQALAYITSRAVMQRLDDVVGPQFWRDKYRSGPDGGVLCGISIKVEDEWITKWDGAENTQVESVKGGISDALKRAAVKWGIGRYLYTLPAIWVDAKIVPRQGRKPLAYFKDNNAPRQRLLPYLQPHLVFPGDLLNEKGKIFLENTLRDLGHNPTTIIKRIFGEDATVENMTTITGRNTVEAVKRVSAIAKNKAEPVDFGIAPNEDINVVVAQIYQACFNASKAGDVWTKLEE